MAQTRPALRLGLVDCGVVMASSKETAAVVDVDSVTAASPASPPSLVNESLLSEEGAAASDSVVDAAADKEPVLWWFSMAIMALSLVEHLEHIV